VDKGFGLIRNRVELWNSVLGSAFCWAKMVVMSAGRRGEPECSCADRTVSKNDVDEREGADQKNHYQVSTLYFSKLGAGRVRR